MFEANNNLQTPKNDVLSNLRNEKVVFAVLFISPRRSGRVWDRVCVFVGVSSDLSSQRFRFVLTLLQKARAFYNCETKSFTCKNGLAFLVQRV